MHSKFLSSCQSSPEGMELQSFSSTLLITLKKGSFFIVTAKSFFVPLSKGYLKGWRQSNSFTGISVCEMRAPLSYKLQCSSLMWSLFSFLLILLVFSHWGASKFAQTGLIYGQFCLCESACVCVCSVHALISGWSGQLVICKSQRRQKKVNLSLLLCSYVSGPFIYIFILVFFLVTTPFISLY